MNRQTDTKVSNARGEGLNLWRTARGRGEDKCSEAYGVSGACLCLQHRWNVNYCKYFRKTILYLEHFFLSAGSSARRSSASMLHRLLTLPSQLVEDGGEAAATIETLVAPATDGNNTGRDVARPPSPLTARKEEEEEEEGGDDGEDKGKKVRKTREKGFMSPTEGRP